MKQIVIDDDVPFLPDEIILNILKRLPAKSLARFQCVSEHWKNLIKNPSFIADHLHHSTHQNPCLLFRPQNSTGPLNLHLLDCEKQVHRVPNHPLIDYLKCGWFVGSSNGLLCIGISKEGVFHHSHLLWNPATREVKQVPKPIDDFEGHYLRVGFGFSPIVNDYKIVRIYVDVIFDDLVEKVEVYSLRTGSWEKVELGILDGVSISSASFTANGAMFWFGFKLEEEDENGNIVAGNVIISFDIAMDVFALMPVPASAPRSHLKRLTMYENKLAMLCCTMIGNSESSLIDLWVMEEGTIAAGEKWIWTKKYTSSPYPCFLCPMTIWRNEIVCSISTGRQMDDEPTTVLFNLTTKEFTELAVGRSRYGHHIFNHVESLMPVGGTKLFTMFV
ncbi:F-box/kelch-repeat protein At3g06240-like [Neltuma alba]|uniref:F-box/kelch-repeat protein At3g06240-like n=1 Tax=Neltuma alba TaxID=207710 RepID=UPI0010A59B9A|nr:F-box/kelch-repeat protein At3g06240-like [Prosopis alba]